MKKSVKKERIFEANADACHNAIMILHALERLRGREALPEAVFAAAESIENFAKAIVHNTDTVLMLITDRAEPMWIQLQDRYPIKVGREHHYKLRQRLTADERAWNVARLRKCGQHEHANALEAEGRRVVSIGRA